MGVRAIPVAVEVVVSNGLPGFSIVGMPDAAVRESTERVRAAIKACGFTMPGDKVVVNLAPSSIRKAGSGFDLPIAAAILAATKQIDVEALGECLLVGELGLDGSVRPVHGTLAFAACARELGCKLSGERRCARRGAAWAHGAARIALACQFALYGCAAARFLRAFCFS